MTHVRPAHFLKALGAAALLCSSGVLRAGPVATPDAAATRAERAIAATYAARAFEQATISPDGQLVAWVETLVGKNGVPDGHSEIYVADAKDGQHAHRVSAAGGTRRATEGDIAWSPDSTRIAFTSDAARPGQAQIYVAQADGSHVRRITNVDGALQAPSWSPDGTRFAVLFTEHANRDLGPLAAATHDVGEIKDAWFEQRLTLVDLASGKVQPLTADDLYVYEYAWAPDASHFAIVAARGNGDNNWWTAALYRQDMGSGPLKLLYKPTLQIAKPVYSPDGQHVAFIEGLMSDQGSVGGDVYMIPAGGGNAENLTPGSKSSATSLVWTKASGLLVAEITGGDAQFARLDTSAKTMTSLWRGPETVMTGDDVINLTLANDGRSSAVIRSSFESPPEIWAGAIGQWRPVTHRNGAAQPAWGKATSLHWKSDGYDVQGWLIYPADFDPAKRYPMIVSVHGGPGDAVTSRWPGQGSVAMSLAGAGYFVLEPNPRGSFGQGEAFTRANVRDFGYGDLRDILAGVDEALRIAPIDAGRLGIAGWSYGGFMTMWTVTQTQRFKAAVAGAGIANWQSYYGQNKIDQWMVPFFGATVYDDPAVYAKSSPIQYIKSAKTPTLVLVGDSDAECPAPQSYEFWHALKSLGTETALVVYDHEGHRFKSPTHQQDRIRRTVNWFDAHLR